MTLRGAPCYQQLADHLLSLSSRRRLIYIKNPGNWGDALIGAGEREFFRHFGIPVDEINSKYVYRSLALKTRIRSRKLKPTIIYGGNGALSGPYPHLHSRINLILKGTVESLILPSTLPRSFETINLPPDISVWRRDETLSLECEVPSRFCHDMAFFLKPEPVEVTEDVGVFFRQDLESSSLKSIPEGNYDISDAGTHQSSTSEFFRAIGKFNTIETDRLHVAIAGALLGRAVRLYSNNYGKIKAVFDASIGPFYPNVIYLGAPL